MKSLQLNDSLESGIPGNAAKRFGSVTGFSHFPHKCFGYGRPQEKSDMAIPYTISPSTSLRPSGKYVRENFTLIELLVVIAMITTQ